MKIPYKEGLRSSPKKCRWPTVDRALGYITAMRGKTDDPVIQRNAEKTIFALKHLQEPCGNASAC